MRVGAHVPAMTAVRSRCALQKSPRGHSRSKTDSSSISWARSRVRSVPGGIRTLSNGGARVARAERGVRGDRLAARASATDVAGPVETREAGRTSRPGRRARRGPLAASGSPCPSYSCSTRCALVPPKPKPDTDAARGRSARRGHGTGVLRDLEHAPVDLERLRRLLEAVLPGDGAVLEGQQHLDHRHHARGPSGVADQRLVGGDLDRMPRPAGSCAGW